jgi:alkanesulfonate monooxygenase SsuD/methylene tetrahydromethanopterin reductase-like flavin-dependent oxidoreductase (luciferase family)
MSTANEDTMADATESPRSFNVGLFATSYFEPGVDPAEGLREMMEEIALAEELGFGSVFLGHHYLTRSSFLQPLTLAAYLAQVTGQMRIGFCVYLVPLHNPVLLAEELATLDTLLGGRLVVGVGTGYRQREYDGAGVPFEGRFQRLEHHLRLMRQLWQGESVSDTWDQAKLDDVRLYYPPAQPGGPPYWIGAVGDRGLRRVAEFDAHWLAGSVEAESDLPRKLSLLREELSKAGRSPHRSYALMREAAVSATRDAAISDKLSRTAEMFQTNYHTFFAERGKLDAEKLLSDYALVGTPDEVTRKLLWYRDELGITDVLLRNRWGSLSHKETMETIQLVGKEVLPALAGNP